MMTSDRTVSVECRARNPDWSFGTLWVVGTPFFPQAWICMWGLRSGDSFEHSSWKRSEVRKWGDLPGSGSYFLKRRWKLGCHLHIVVGQHWTDWWQIEWERWRKWTEWVQELNPEEPLFWAGLWRRHRDQISHIGPSETGRTQATLEHCHRHHTLSEVELVKSSDQWCRRQHWGWVTQESWIPPIDRQPSFV